MTSEQIRDPLTDNLLTPANCALVIIDYQPTQINSIRSVDRAELIDHIVRVAKTAVLYKVPVVLSTVNVKSGRNQPTIAALEAVIPHVEALDRTTINAWEDVEFPRGDRNNWPQEAGHDGALDRSLSHRPNPRRNA